MLMTLLTVEEQEYYFKDNSVAFQIFGGTDEALSLLDEEQQKKEIYFLDETAIFYFLLNPISPEDFAASCDELGYIKDYQNLHFYVPDNYVYVCNKSSGYANILSDTYSVKETEHYRVFYME